MYSAGLVLVNKVEFDEGPALGVPEGKYFHGEGLTFGDDVFHDDGTAILSVDSYFALLDLIVEDFALVSCHDGHASFEAFGHNVVFDGALEGACEDESFDAAGEDAVFDDDGG